MTRYLILVSPGSALGSAIMTLGTRDGRAQRQALADEIAGWNGHLITFRGELDDEIADYPRFAETIEGANARAKAAGHTVAAYDVVDDDVATAIADLLGEHTIPRDAEIICTGAWASLIDSGLVNAVRDAFKAVGYTHVEISDSAVFEPEDEDPHDAVMAAFA